MALVDQYHAFVKLGDSRQKITEVRFRVPTDVAQIYINALTQILKDATEVGQFLLSIQDLSAATMMAKGVTLETVDDAAVFPDPQSSIYNFDKLMVSYTAQGFNYNLTIPSRDDTNYDVATDGVTVDLTAGTVDDFVSRFNALVLSKYGVQGTVTEITVVS